MLRRAFPRGAFFDLPFLRRRRRRRIRGPLGVQIDFRIVAG